VKSLETKPWHRHDDYSVPTTVRYPPLPIPEPGETATAGEIITFCAERLAAYKVPKLVEFRASLPKSMIGKVLRKVLQAEEKAKSKT